MAINGLLVAPSNLFSLWLQVVHSVDNLWWLMRGIRKTNRTMGAYFWSTDLKLEELVKVIPKIRTNISFPSRAGGICGRGAWQGTFDVLYFVRKLLDSCECGELCQESVCARTISPSNRWLAPVWPFRSIGHRGEEPVRDLESVLPSRDPEVWA